MATTHWKTAGDGFADRTNARYEDMSYDPLNHMLGRPVRQFAAETLRADLAPVIAEDVVRKTELDAADAKRSGVVHRHNIGATQVIGAGANNVEFAAASIAANSDATAVYSPAEGAAHEIVINAPAYIVAIVSFKWNNTGAAAEEPTLEMFDSGGSLKVIRLGREANGSQQYQSVPFQHTQVGASETYHWALNTADTGEIIDAQLQMYLYTP